MDIESEQKRAKWLLRFGVGLVITSFFAWGELMYAVAGTNVDATVGKTEIVEQSRRGQDTSYKVVNYTFTDKAGNARTGYDRVADSFQASEGSKVPVTYRGNDPEGSSRLAGTRWFGIAVWLVFFAPTAWFVGGMIKESAEWSREKKERAASAKKPYRF